MSTLRQNRPDLADLVARSRDLYSLPAVAMKVLQLTECSKVNAQALKECFEMDPALTAKLLRVVNSSLFGLSRRVSDLNQALAMLGTKPLKLRWALACLTACLETPRAISSHTTGATH